MPHDGVLEHNFLLNQHIEEARRNHQDRFLAWLDISNAFGSVPHEVIINALIAAGVDREFVALVTNIYRNSTTRVFAGEELTDPIAINPGGQTGGSAEVPRHGPVQGFPPSFKKGPRREMIAQPFPGEGDGVAPCWGAATSSRWFFTSFGAGDLSTAAERHTATWKQALGSGKERKCGKVGNG
ncbi:retrovirus-related Pol polyprotein from type-1 retrotransposable element R2 [Trichonephila inaurata madagascariensis]|uniref:Retrovirus-related Pol polyprotein from type-1 retrotransposable element R2 n=1 Tax=Trichonephila inaurata madagascariensis TaxID=2747483 RepID=A0A8X6XNC4_9ARAC|nr:retrovirus-related Pol polyprotein from type-1 retrotransposable element R2 [Trichonephila inaurata madagascariensis]